MNALLQRIGLPALGLALLSGCSSEQNIDVALSAKQKAAREGFAPIDDNTYLIAGHSEEESLEQTAVFGQNLARFRREVGGEFDIIFSDVHYPFNGSALAVRRERHGDQKNTVNLKTPGLAEAPLE